MHTILLINTIYSLFDHNTWNKKTIINQILQEVPRWVGLYSKDNILMSVIDLHPSSALDS